MDDFREHLERMLKVDERILLGFLVWYSVSNVRMPHTSAVRALVQAGIDTNLPLPPRDDDVFRRVCTSAGKRKVPTADEGIYENYLVRDLNADSEKVYRRVVCEKVDAKGKRLGYEQLYDITFNKETSAITRRKLGPTSAMAEQIVDTIQQQFLAERGSLSSYAIREWIRHFLLRTSATQVRPGGGVYFLAEEHRDKIEALEAFCKEVPGDVEFHYLPLIDDSKQREMLQRAYEAETAGAIDELLVEITAIRSKGKKITAAKYEKYLNLYHELLEKTKEYEQLLEGKLDSTHSRLEVYMKSMMELTQSHVKF